MSKPTNIEVHLVQRFDDESRYEVIWKEGEMNHTKYFNPPGDYRYANAPETGGIRTFDDRLQDAKRLAIAFARILEDTNDAEIRTKIDF